MVRAWRYDLEGVSGHTIPIYLLDTDLPRTTRAIESLPITSMVEIRITGCARKPYWGSVVCAFSMR
jgi:hypothetical protein